MRPRSIRGIFAVPVLVAIVTLVGLGAGLLGDGWWDAASWVGLGVPVAIAFFRYAGSPAKAGAQGRQAGRP